MGEKLTIDNTKDYLIMDAVEDTALGVILKGGDMRLRLAKAILDIYDGIDVGVIIQNTNLIVGIGVSFEVFFDGGSDLLNLVEILIYA